MSSISASELQVKFKKKRSEVSEEIQKCIAKMASFDGLKEVQVLMLSLRQRLLEDNHSLLETLSVVRKRYRNERSKQMESISVDLQHRYQYNEKNAIIDGKTANTQEIIDIIENQISFFNDSMRTVDHVIYGIKSRVEIEKVLGL